MLVEVTQEDISEGLAGNCCFCPVALAVKRSLGLNKMDKTLYVGGAITKYNSPAAAYHEKSWAVPKPDLVREFIYNFDAGLPSKRAKCLPFSFDLDIPSEVTSA